MSATDMWWATKQLSSKATVAPTVGNIPTVKEPITPWCTQDECHGFTVLQLWYTFCQQYEKAACSTTSQLKFEPPCSA